MSKCPLPVSRHLLTRQRDARLTPTTSGISNSNYVIMVSDCKCPKYFCVFLYCNLHWHMVITLHLCVLCGSQNKQERLLYTSLTDWVSQQNRRVFTAQYGRNSYITRIHLVLQGLKTKRNML